MQYMQHLATLTRTLSPRRLPIGVAAFTVLALSAAPAGAQIIDTRLPESQGSVTTPNFGQTFTAPDGATLLERFSFFTTSNADDPVTFTAYLMRWDGSRAQGDVLYSSGPRAASGCCTIVQEIFEANVAVTAGDMYVAFINPAPGSSMVHRRAYAAGASADSYAEGEAVFNFGCIDDPTSCNWGKSAWDREFVAEFSGAQLVPEPAHLSLLGAALTLLLLLRTRRPRRTT